MLNNFFTGNSQLDLLALVAENTALKEEREKLLRANCNIQQQLSEQQQSSKKRFAYQNLSNKDCHYYTGYSKEQFDDIYIFLVPTADDPIKWTKSIKGSKVLPTSDQVLLTLIKLRQNFDFQQFSHLFEISSQDCSAIFTHWINCFLDYGV